MEEKQTTEAQQKSPDDLQDLFYPISTPEAYTNRQERQKCSILSFSDVPKPKVKKLSR